jgi:hypothetical protein
MEGTAFLTINQTVEVEAPASAIIGIAAGRGATHRKDAADPTTQISAHNSNGSV